MSYSAGEEAGAVFPGVRLLQGRVDSSRALATERPDEWVVSECVNAAGYAITAIARPGSTARLPNNATRPPSHAGCGG
jgi:hypothetical protein